VRRFLKGSFVNIDLLKRLCETPGVPGREERVRKLIESEISGLFDEVRTDAMGSLICTRHPRKGKKPAKKKSDARPTRVMLLCHMDEIGFYVSCHRQQGLPVDEPRGRL
jgi:putative aminopeptidase FrvX